MKHKIFIIFTLINCLFTTSAFSTTWTAETLPIPYFKDAHQFVSNPDHIISPAILDSVNNIFYKIEQQRGVQTLVAVVEHLKDGDCYNFAMDLGRKHGVGNKDQQSGLIIVLSTKDRCYQIITGYGLEGTLPDAICKRIENKYMVPSLKKGDWNTALLLTTRAIENYIIGDKSLIANNKRKRSDDMLPALIISAFIIIFLVIAAINNKKRRCPKCQKRTLKPIKTEYLRTNNGKKIRRVTYHCKNCNYLEVRDENDNDFHNDRGALFPPIFFGGGRNSGGFGGGGFGGGGSFGGGGFGGGGAGGRF